MLKKLNSLKNHSGFMKYFKNISWLFAEKILRMVVGLFVGVWVARYLGPEQFGLFSYALSFVGLFTAFATLGLDGIVVRELVKYPEKEDKIIGTVFWLKVIGAFCVLLLLGIVVSFTLNDKTTNMLIFIIASATIFQSFNVIDMYFQSKVMSKYVVFANMISLLVSSIVKIWLIFIQAPLIWFAWSVLLDSFILACGLMYFYIQKKSIKIKYLKFYAFMAKTLIKDAWPLILSGIVISIYMKIDQVMIKEMLGNNAVGQYAAAVRLSEIWYFVPIVVVSSLFPAIINAKKQSHEVYYSRLQSLYDLMVVLAIAIAIPMTFLSHWIIDLLYGEAYSKAGGVLMIHIWTSIFVFLGVASGKWFVVENLQKYSFYRSLIGVSVNVILNFILIPMYSIYGAAIATVIAQLAASYVFNFTNKKLLDTFKMQTNSILFPLRKLGINFV